MYTKELTTERAADMTCETLICDNLVWLERKLEAIGDPCTSEQRLQAKRFKMLLDSQKRKLNDLRRGKRGSWFDADN